MSVKIKEYKGKKILIINDKPAKYRCEQMQCCKCPLYDKPEACMSVGLHEELINACEYFNAMIEKDGTKYHNRSKSALLKKKTWSCEEKLFNGQRRWGDSETDNDCYFDNKEKKEV